MLRSDGTAVACGRVAELVEDLTCVQVAAGGRCTAMLRGDGTAAACGDVAELVEGLTYVQVAAGEGRTAQLRSEGTPARGHFAEVIDDLAYV